MAAGERERIGQLFPNAEGLVAGRAAGALCGERVAIEPDGVGRRVEGQCAVACPLEMRAARAGSPALSQCCPRRPCCRSPVVAASSAAAARPCSVRRVLVVQLVVRNLAQLVVRDPEAAGFRVLDDVAIDELGEGTGQLLLEDAGDLLQDARIELPADHGGRRAGRPARAARASPAAG